MAKTRSINDIRTQINNLQKIEVCVGHNEGTFSAVEACRKVGTGDPSFATRYEYETVDGDKRATGPSIETMPGHMQYAGRQTLAEYRRELQSLYAELRDAE